MIVRPERVLAAVGVATFLTIGVAQAGIDDEARKKLAEDIREALAAEAEMSDSARRIEGARIPWADSRLGPWLLGSGVHLLPRYLDRLASIGVKYVGMRIARPILTGQESRHDGYRRFYRYAVAETRKRRMTPVVTIGLQYRDDDFYRGQTDYLQCREGYRARFSAYVADVVELLQPAFLVIDVRPTTLGRAPGCASIAGAGGAESLARAAAHSLRHAQFSGRWGISVDLAAEDGFLERAAELPGKPFLALSALNVPADPESLGAALERVRALADAKGRDVAITEAWIRKSDLRPSNYAAEAWSDFDRAMARTFAAYARQHGWLFASVYETDLLLGGYADGEELAALAAGFDEARGTRRFVQYRGRRTALGLESDQQIPD